MPNSLNPLTMPPQISRMDSWTSLGIVGSVSEATRLYVTSRSWSTEPPPLILRTYPTPSRMALSKSTSSPILWKYPIETVGVDHPYSRIVGTFSPLLLWIRIDSSIPMFVYGLPNPVRRRRHSGLALSTKASSLVGASARFLCFSPLLD